MPSPDNAAGHRRRLREKFLKSGLSAFHDYEIVELLLTLGSPRKDCKPAAKEAIKKFKTLRGIFEASQEQLQEIKGIGPSNTFGIRFVKEVASEYLKEKIIAKPMCNSSQEVFDYLYQSMRDLKKEVFKVIYLNSQNEISSVEDLFQGTVNTSSVIPREVIESALKNNAVSLIFAHNHPSGNPKPSKNDREITRDLVQAAIIVQLKVLDHIIIGDNKYFSFAEDGFITKCELDFAKMQMKYGKVGQYANMPSLSVADTWRQRSGGNNQSNSGSINP